MKTVAVIDIGKTNVKLALVDLDEAREIAVETEPNIVLPGPPWPHFDTDGQWHFLVSALRRMAATHQIDGITVTTHGACAALLDKNGGLAAPVLDYEHDGPDAFSESYEALRPHFDETGSPRLPLGLNLGAQLHYMLQTDPDLLARTAHIVTWPQYWGFRLSGQLACDVSSLGCHTDLWRPYEGAWSDLPARLGLAERLAPPRKPGDVLGRLTPKVQAATGLGPIPVLTGVHDSNASLIPHLLSRPPPFSVVSTGTWIISMALGGRTVALDPARDTLINVSAFGKPVPSARFMGGREYDLIRPRLPFKADAADVDCVLDRQVMLLPSVIPGSGPFPKNRFRWSLEPENDAEREIALSFALALTAATCLELIGAAGPTIVEGPMSANRWLAEMLECATGREVITSSTRTGTALGAAMLFLTKPDLVQPRESGGIRPNPKMAIYGAAWRQATEAG